MYELATAVTPPAWRNPPSVVTALAGEPMAATAVAAAVATARLSPRLAVLVPVISPP